MESQEQRPGTISAIVQLGNPVFIILSVVLPNAALGVAMMLGSLMLLNYVHIMTGALWTGIDLFMGFVIGPLLGSMEPQQRAEVFKRLIPNKPAAIFIGDHGLSCLLAGKLSLRDLRLLQQYLPFAAFCTAVMQRVLRHLRRTTRWHLMPGAGPVHHIKGDIVFFFRMSEAHN